MNFLKSKLLTKSTQTLLPYFQYCYSSLNVFPKFQKYKDDSLGKENVVNVYKVDTSIFWVSSINSFMCYVTFGEKVRTLTYIFKIGSEHL